MVGIYKITSPIGLVYIGKSKNIEKRLAGYKNLGAGSQPKLHASFITYGICNHKFEIILECEFKELHNMEGKYIDLYNTTEQLNCCRVNQSDKVRIAYKKPDNWKDYLKQQLLRNPLPAKPQPKKGTKAYKQMKMTQAMETCRLLNRLNTKFTV